MKQSQQIMIQVLNKHFYEGDGYYIGRPSPLGNPFSHHSKSTAVRVRSREEALEKYEAWLEEQEEGSVVLKELRKLVAQYKEKGYLKLICWCAPASCHGHIIARKIEEMLENENID